MKHKHHIYLIPGFFGFTNLGGIRYFAHVHEYLAEACRSLGHDVEITTVNTHPTASVRKRTERLAVAISQNTSYPDQPVHLVGHSSGGLDARLLATPGLSLDTGVDVESIAKRIRTVVTVSTPHYGTPLAEFSQVLLGKHLFRILVLMTIHVLRFGQVPISAFLKLGAAFVRLDDIFGFPKTVADQVYNELLGDFSPDRRKAVQQFLSDMQVDQALFTQLTPEGIDLFNASSKDRPDVRYGCVVTSTKSHGLSEFVDVGIDPYAQASHVIFKIVSRLSRAKAGRYEAKIVAHQAGALRRAFGRIPSPKRNDGIVPTKSQLWGEVIHAAWADHLDSIGHFRSPNHIPPHYDWLESCSGFDRSSFERLWSDVAVFLFDG